MVPVLGAVMISVLPLRQTRAGWRNFSPRDVTFANYTEVWGELSEYAINSVIIAVLAIAITVGTGVAAAYAFARLDFRFKRTLYFLLITTMIVPVQIILIPLLPWFRTLHLNDGPLQYLASPSFTAPSGRVGRSS
jgi:multiple sugar transport system permease protein